MMLHNIPRATLLTFAAAVLLLGCSNDDKSEIDPGNVVTEAPEILAVEPRDGQMGALTTTAVGIKFDMPMDPASLRAGFHLSGGDEMHAWMDSLGHHGGGMMGDPMVDMDHMLAWMDSVHYQGDWHWNDLMDSCYFVPDQPLMPHTDHMIYLYGDILSAHGTHMEMGNHAFGGPMFHFQTGP